MEVDHHRKPEPAFMVRLDGPGIRPWEVPVRALARILQAIQRLVAEQDDDESGIDEGTRQIPEEAALDDQRRSLRLLDIKSGSAVYKVAAGDPGLALEVLRRTGKAIRKPDSGDWPGSALSSVEELSDVARSLGCTIELVQPDDARHSAVMATIRPTTYEEIEGIAFIKGGTSVFGKIERVGGATARHCGLRLPERPRKMLVCRVESDDLVRQLGQYMYQDVVVSGEATWLRRNWELKHLTIKYFDPPKTGSLLDALKNIHDAGGDAWDKFPDPDAAISEMRTA
jgi:hypothetical protein